MTDIKKAKRLTQLFYIMQHQHKQESPHNQSMRRRDIMALEAITNLLGKNEDSLIKMNELSEFFHITPAAISQMVRDYETKGWLERVVLDNDRRSVYLKVTEDAKRLIKRNEEAAMRDIIDFLEYLGEEDSDAFLRILERAVEYGPLMKHNMKEE